MKTIYKYPLNELRIPACAFVMHVGLQDGRAWAAEAAGKLESTPKGDQ